MWYWLRPVRFFGVRPCFCEPKCYALDHRHWTSTHVRVWCKPLAPKALLTAFRYFTQAGHFAPGPDPNFCMGGGTVEPLFAKYKVDLALWGHVHNAIVTCPVNNATCVTKKQPDGYDATVHVVIGNGGQTLSGCPKKPPAWQHWCGNFWGWNVLNSHNATHLDLVLSDNPTNTVQQVVSLVREFPRSL